MRIAIIGRSEVMLATAEQLHAAGHEIALVVTSKEAPEYRVTADDFAAFAQRVGAPFIRTARIREARDRIAALGRIEIAASVNYAGVIPAEIIDLFPLGILNAHGGDLPRYRGNACQAWAILQGEPHVGLCIHRMVGGELDSGDIVGYDQFPLDLQTKVGTVWAWLNQRIPPLFAEAIDALAADPAFVIRRQSDDPRPPLRCYPRKPEDGRIDWRQPAEAIVRLVNASGRPYAGAFCAFDGARLTVWDAGVVDDGEVFLAVPGQVTAIRADEVHIATGHGKVALREVALDGAAIPPGAITCSLRTRLS